MTFPQAIVWSVTVPPKAHLMPSVVTPCITDGRGMADKFLSIVAPNTVRLTSIKIAVENIRSLSNLFIY